MMFNKAFCFGLNSFNLNVPNEQDGCCEETTLGIESIVKMLLILQLDLWKRYCQIRASFAAVF